MNSKRRRLLAWIVLVLVVLGSASSYLLSNFVEDRREQARPPSIIIHTPNDGAIVDADSILLAHVTAAGVNPILRVEMWVNGELNSTHNQEPSSGESAVNLQALFDMDLAEGSHMIYWRAVDNAGLIGQTRMITIFAQIPEAGEEAVVVTEEGQTLEDIANAEGVDMGAVGELNPELGQGALPPGTNVNIPKPPAAGGPSQPPAVSIIPPNPLPITPPGTAPLLQISGIVKIIDIGAFISAIRDSMPKAPSGLHAGFEDCTIRLTWIDNADNETHFNVWMQRLGGPAQLINTLPGSSATGPAWTDFNAPAFGIYSFWVEAANGLGTQPSEMQGVAVNDAECKQDVLATRLEIEAVDMHVSGNINDVYCYLSIEGAAHQRIPEVSSIRVLNGWGDIVKHWGGQKRILLPIPADNEVSLEGKCLGAAGTMPLGEFQARVPAEQWDGRRLQVSDHGFSIGYRILLHGDSQAQGVFHYTDHDIISPRVLAVKDERASDPTDISEVARLGRLPTILWEWKGDESKITSFNILLDGKLLQWAETDWRKTRILLPTGCGYTYQLQVVANAGDAQSVPSPVYEHIQPQCELLAEIKFESITFTEVDDGQILTSCDDAQAYYDISVHASAHSEFRRFWDSNYASNTQVTVSCGEFTFDRLAVLSPQEHKYESLDTFLIPISPQNTEVIIRATFEEDDDSPFDDNDVLCMTLGVVNMSTLEWSTYSDVLTLPC